METEFLTSVATITPEELAAKWRAGSPIELIDVRTPVEYREMHAEPARSLPLDGLDPKAVIGSRNGKPDDPIYIICRSGGRSRAACEKFLSAGYGNVFSVEGGTLEWAKAGLSVIRDTRVISLERQVRIAAGSLVVLGTALGAFVHPGFLVLSGFVGAGLVFAGVTDACGMAMLLARMPWNRVESSSVSCSTRGV